MIAKLHYITQDHLPISHAAQAKLALEGGVKWVQFRSKVLTELEIRSEALIIKELCKTYGATCILNDNWQLAIDLDLDGVHVGLNDTPIEVIRMQTDFIIGGTANTFKDIQLHYSQGANYVGVGPYCYTETKKNLSPVLGGDGFKKIIFDCKKAAINLPVIAIGGIQLSDIQTIKNLGVYGVAIASQINKAKNPTLSAQEFIAYLAK